MLAVFYKYFFLQSLQSWKNVKISLNLNFCHEIFARIVMCMCLKSQIEQRTCCIWVNVGDYLWTKCTFVSFIPLHYMFFTKCTCSTFECQCIAGIAGYQHDGALRDTNRSKLEGPRHGWRYTEQIFLACFFIWLHSCHFLRCICEIHPVDLGRGKQTLTEKP